MRLDGFDTYIPQSLARAVRSKLHRAEIRIPYSKGLRNFEAKNQENPDSNSLTLSGKGG